MIKSAKVQWSLNPRHQEHVVLGAELAIGLAVGLKGARLAVGVGGDDVEDRNLAVIALDDGVTVVAAESLSGLHLRHIDGVP